MSLQKPFHTISVNQINFRDKVVFRDSYDRYDNVPCESFCVRIGRNDINWKVIALGVVISEMVGRIGTTRRWKVETSEMRTVKVDVKKV